jgi:hypothetical protein
MFRALMRNLSIVLLLGAAACGSTTDPSASGVFPSSGFLGRQVRVEVSGDATEWGASTKVNFGEGITVDSIDVASPTALFANITISDSAPIGLHDVVVTGGDNATLTQAFEVESPISITVRGAAAQGSVALLDIVNHDFDTPFDTTSTGDGFFTPLRFVGLDANAGNGVTIQFTDVGAYTASATLLIDVDAQTGPLTIASGTTATTTSFPLGADLAIAARTAMPLTAGTNATFVSTKPYDSALYEFTPAMFPALARFQISSSDTDASPGLAILPASGHFADLLGAAADQRQVAKSGKFYAIAYDLSGEMASYQARAGSQVLTIVGDTEPGNSTTAGALACTLPCLVENATLGSSTDQDWYKFTSGANDTGKHLHVTTLAGDDFTDTLVDAFEVQGANSTSLGGPSDDNGYHEDFQFPTALKNATNYTVKIYASPMFDASQTHYDGLIYLE